MGTAVAVAGFLLLATFGRVWTVFDTGPFSANFFDAQARSMIHGHLAVDEQVASIEGFHHDGKTYLYFGVVPAVLHMPTAAVTDALDGRLVIVSMTAALAVALLAAGRLLFRARRWWSPDTPVTRRDTVIAGAFVAAIGLSSPLLFLSARGLVYHEAIAWGVAFTLVAFDAALEWWERPSAKALALASLASVAALNSRASVGLGGVVALGFLVMARVRTLSRRQLLAGLCAVSAPFVLFVSVNIIRFGSPTSIPYETQGINHLDPRRAQMLRDNNGTIVGPQFIPTSFVDYLRPDGIRVSRLFPWVTFRNSVFLVGHVNFERTDHTSSLPAEAGALCVLAAVGAFTLVRRRTGAAPWMLVAAAGVVGIGPTLAIGLIANRYLADFVPALVVPAAIGLWVVRDHRAARRVLAALAVVGFGIVGALTLQSERLYLLPSETDRAAFVGLQYDIDNALFGGRPPHVERGDALPSESTDATTFIVGNCDGLYWWDGFNWMVLERAETDTPLCDRLQRRLVNGGS